MRARLPLLGAVGALLLISCVNVSNMLLSRTYARRRELAGRTALGATGRRLVRQMLNENLFSFVLGGLLGAICAIWSQTLLLRLLPAAYARHPDRWKHSRLHSRGVAGNRINFRIGSCAWIAFVWTSPPLCRRNRDHKAVAG